MFIFKAPLGFLKYTFKLTLVPALKKGHGNSSLFSAGTNPLCYIEAHAHHVPSCTISLYMYCTSNFHPFWFTAVMFTEEELHVQDETVSLKTTEVLEVCRAPVTTAPVSLRIDTWRRHANGSCSCSTHAVTVHWSSNCQTCLCTWNVWGSEKSQKTFMHSHCQKSHAVLFFERSLS